MKNISIRLVLVSLLVLPSLSAAQQEAVSDTPDYASLDSWLCHPDNELDLCDQAVTITTVAPDGSLSETILEEHPDPPIDCFYIYPTTSLDSGTNSDMHPGRHEEIVTTFTQFAPFKSQCRVFAPIYRQITIAGLLANAGNLAGPENTNYQDVLASMRYYMENYNNGRGVVLVGHSQGTSLLIEILRNEVENKPEQDLLVSAILAGNPVIVPEGQDVGGTFQTIPLCRSASQTACILNFMTYRDSIPPEGFALFGRGAGEETQAGCTNPANLAGGSGEFDAYLSNVGEVVQFVAPLPDWTNPPIQIDSKLVRVPGLLSGRCVYDGTFNYLEMSVNADPNDARTDDIRGDLYQGTEISREWGLHLVDMTVVMGNLLDIVRQQAAAYTNR